MNKKKKLLLDKDIKATIRLLRHLTHGQGYASISLFDAGAGGFQDGKVIVFLERDGITLNEDGKINAYTPQELFDQIKSASDPFSTREESFTIEQRNKWYKERKWNDGME